MSPTVLQNSFVISVATPSKEIKKGDIVLLRTVTTNSQDVLGRVTSVQAKDNNIYQYELKGDNNPTPDPWDYKTGSETFKLYIAIPVVGFFINILHAPLGAAAFILIGAALMIAYLFGLFGSRTFEEKQQLVESRAARAEEEKNRFGNTETMKELFVKDEPTAEWYKTLSRNKMRDGGEQLQEVGKAASKLSNLELTDTERVEAEHELNLAIVVAREIGEPWKSISKAIKVKRGPLREKFSHKVMSELKRGN